MPENFLEKCKSHIKSEWKLAFYSSVVIGLLTHIFIFTNSLPNHDGIVDTYDAQLKFSLGRFFLSPFAGISSYFDLPVVIGMLSIFYLALTAVVLTEFFELKKSISIMLISGLIVTFPTISATFSYMFTADGYMAGTLITGLALLLTKKYKFGFLVGAILFYLGVGVYQANLPFLLTLITIFLLNEIINKDLSTKTFWVYVSRFFATTVIGMALYAFTFKLYNSFFAGEISDYQGLNNIGESNGSLIDSVIDVKDSAMEFFFRGFITDMPVNLFEILNVFILALIIGGIALTIFQKKVYRNISSFLLVILLVLSMPFSAYCLYFVSPEVSYHMLMVLSLLSFYLLPIIIYDNFSFTAITNKFFSWITVIISVLIIFNFSLIANISYYNQNLKYESSVAAANRLIDRIQQVDEFEIASKLAIFGSTSLESTITNTIIPENTPEMTGSQGNYFLYLPYHYLSILENRFGVQYKPAKQEEYETIFSSNGFKDMATWPAESSVRLFGDIVVIKLSEQN